MKPSSTHDLADSFDELELPPLADDTHAEPEKDVMLGALGEYEEDSSPPGESDGELITEREVVADLIATGEVSLLDDSPSAAGSSIDLDSLAGDMFHSEEDGASAEGDAVPALEDLLSLDDESPGEAIGADNGAEGPLEETVEIDTSGWDELSHGSDDEPHETVEQAMARLGIALPDGEPQAPDAAGFSDENLGECHFLGPSDAPESVCAVVLGPAGPVAVGGAVYQIAADGLFHAVEDLPEIESLGPTNAVVVGDSVFLGTTSAGLKVIDLKTRRIRSLNGWMSLGWGETGAEPSSAGTAIRVSHIPAAGGRGTLLVETEEGQLFAGADLGSSWTGPLLREKTVGLAVNQSTAELILVCAGENGEGPSLRISKDCVTYDVLPLPTELTGLLAGSRDGERPAVLLEAAGDTVAVGLAGRVDCLWISVNRGASWGRVAFEQTVAAVSLDHQSPNWIAVACNGPDAQLGCIRISEDGGRHWLYLEERLVCEDADGQVCSAGQVVGLAVASGLAQRRVYARTTRGVFELIFPLQDGVH